MYTKRISLTGGLTWRELLRRVVHECIADDLAGRSAQLSYYFLLAIFPFFLLLATMLGLMAQTGSNILDNVLSYVGRVAPGSAYHLVQTTLAQIRAGAGAGKLSVGIFGTLWAASMGVGAVISGLNKAYEVTESRPWWKAQLLAIVLTLVIGTFIVSALTILLYGSRGADWLANTVGLERGWIAVWKVAQWPAAILIVLVALMIVYRYAPDLRDQRWIRVLPGAAVAAVLWLAVSAGLRVYLHFHNTYDVTYGSLGGVIILLLWFYLSGAAILIGGEVNSEIENAAAMSGERDAHLPGEKVPRVKS